ncbi:hypothetical protein ETAA8_35430 [Anatilimnocola aggregata]|uniref:Amino acid kinase family protein n=1 Tax=Anatilimnocola aggregata TaxID=2528021 RepID=A0A517YDY0_9BACT|nr:hypothetical protein [Anatilimnocola aggregata]QDU28443.1 hypothetical protein ETAA8_35430 [Anatilimnocola aggregata]
MSRSPIRVVKVGGSLFDLPDLGRRLRAWLAAQTPATNVLIAGGGELADVIRNWNQRFALGEERSHWLCIELLSTTAKVLSEVLVECRWIDLFADLRTCLDDATSMADLPVVFDLQQFLYDVEPTTQPESLPHHWGVTTDSIAARLAEVVLADELVLLKSLLPPADAKDFAALAAAGYVDDYFPHIASRVKCVRYETLLELD